MIKIVCAAIKMNDVIIPCVRHWDENCHYLVDEIWDKEQQHEIISSGNEIQGFLDNKGKFYNREEAAILFNSYSDKKVSKLLFSEDLY